MATEAADPRTDAGPAEDSGLIRAAAGLSLGAALIHAAVVGVHFREYWLFGVLFTITAVFQLVWAGLVWTRPAAQRLLAAGVAFNLGVAAVWVVSRTVGLPIGPGSGEPVAAGIDDVLATVDELALAGLVIWALRAPRPSPAAARAALVAWVLVADSVAAALIGSNGVA